MTRMSSMEETIIQYRISCSLVQGRIDALTCQINETALGVPRNQLCERRARLFVELWDMQWALHRMSPPYPLRSLRGFHSPLSG